MERSPAAHRLQLRAQDLVPLLFGMRTATAVLAALWLAMWLQLQNPRWAAWTVIAIALPTRGQVKRKGLARLVGTLLGLAGGLFGVACFSQDPLAAGMFLAGWMALAALIGGRLPALGAYGVALAGLTTGLIMLETVGDPLGAFDLALERSSGIVLGVVCAYAVSTAAEILQGPGSGAAPPTLLSPSRATVLANAWRIALLVGIAWGIWVVTAWPSGPIFIILVGSLGLNLTTLPNADRVAWPCLWGVGLGQASGLLLKFGVLTATPSFALLAVVLFPFLLIGAVGLTDRRSMVPALGFNIAFLLAVEPRNPMQYDLAASLNEAVAVLAGVALVIGAHRIVLPQRLWRFP